jgi:choline-glycine betaine transporter
MAPKRSQQNQAGAISQLYTSLASPDNRSVLTAVTFFAVCFVSLLHLFTILSRKKKKRREDYNQSITSDVEEEDGEERDKRRRKRRKRRKRRWRRERQKADQECFDV